MDPQSKPPIVKSSTPTVLTFDEALALTSNLKLMLSIKFSNNGGVHVSSTEFGKFNYFLIFVCGAILTTVLLETLGISFVLPVSECDMELTTQDKGILSAIGFGGSSMAQNDTN